MRCATPTKLAVFLFLGLGNAQASPSFFTYEAKHRPAHELAAVLTPLVAGRATVSAMNGKVIVNGSPADHRVASQLLSELDRQVWRYRVTLRVAAEASAAYEATGLELAAAASSAQLAKRSRLLGRGRLEAGSAGSKEGQQASMDINEGSEGLLVAGDVALRLKVRRAGNGRAFLEVAQRAGAGAQDFTSVTELALEIGRWLPLASLQQTRSSESTQILQREGGRGSENLHTMVRVDRLGE